MNFLKENGDKTTRGTHKKVIDSGRIYPNHLSKTEYFYLRMLFRYVCGQSPYNSLMTVKRVVKKRFKAASQE